jgi:WD40 repeat protein
MLYKAFISYSHHGTDFAFAVALEAALQRFAAPSNGQPNIRIFRDATNLSATPELWPTIQHALENSEFLLLIASDESAKSKWVNQEIAHWRARGQPGHLLLALTTGTILWDNDRSDFDFVRSTALPPSISGAFVNEPLYVDFAGLQPQYYDLNHPVFCDRVAMLASTLRGVSKDELFGLYVGQRIAAEAARLSAEAELALRDNLPERSLLLGVAALQRTDDRGEPRSAAADSVIRAALNRFGGKPLGALINDAVTPPLAFSRDGRWLATIDKDGHANVRDLKSPNVYITKIDLPHVGAVVKIAFSADGKWLVSQWDIGTLTIRAWDVESGFTQWHDLSPPEQKYFTCAVLSVEQTHLVAACNDGTVLVWDLQDGARGQPLVTLNAGGSVRLLACAAQQKRVAAITGDLLWLWDLADDQGTGLQISLEKARTFQLAFSPDGQWVLCQGENSFLLHFRQDDLHPAIPLTAYRGRIWKHSFSSDSRWLVTATGPTAYEELVQAYYPEFTVRLWDLDRHKAWDLLGHEEMVCDVAITPDGNRVLSASLDRTIRLWDFSGLRRFQEERIQHQAEGNADWAKDVPGGDLDAHEAYVAQQAFRDHKVLLGGDAPVFHCIPGPDGKWIGTVALASGSARLWQIDTGFGASPLELPKIATSDALGRISLTQKWFFYSVLARASGGTAEFSASRDWLLLWVEGHLLVFDVLHDRPSALWTLDVPFESAALSPDGQWVAIRTKTKAFLVRPNDPNQSFEIVSDTESFNDVYFSACGRWLITVEANEWVCIRDLRRSNFIAPVSKLHLPGTQPVNIATNQTGSLLFAGGNSESATVWQLDDTGNATTFMDIPGHVARNLVAPIYGQFTSDGRWLLTSDSGLLQVWDLANRTLHFQVAEHNLKTGFYTALTSDARWLVVSQHGRLSLFDMQKPDAAGAPVLVREYAAGRVRFALSPDSRWLVAADMPYDEPAGPNAPPLTGASIPTVRVHDLWAPNSAGSSVALPGLGSEAQRLAISWDSRWLATTGERVKLWPLGVPALLEIATQTAGRDFTDEERSRYMLA